MMKRLARWLAVWFGCGYVPVAPGTAGTLGALPLYYLVRGIFGPHPIAIFAAAVLFTAIGIWAAGVVAVQEKLKDPQIVVIDEVAGVLFALSFAPMTTKGVIAAFVLFRLFDSTKPFPARRAEKLPGGYGIVLDDVVAGFQSAIVIMIFRYFGGLG